MARPPTVGSWANSNSSVAMAGTDDLSSLSDAQLVAAYVENVQACETIGHVGAHNRLMGHRASIEAELRTRSDGTFQPLRSLLDHPDPNVRRVAAITFRTIDHAAFERTVRALAERTDEIGRNARQSLELDARFQKFGYPEQRGNTPRAVGPFAANVHWQSGNPPPDAMTGAEIEQLLRHALPADCVHELLRLARPAIGLWPQRPLPDMPISASRLGGMPHAPPGCS